MSENPDEEYVDPITHTKTISIRIKSIPSMKNVKFIPE